MYNSTMIKTKERQREDGTRVTNGGKILKENWKTVVEILKSSKPPAVRATHK
jgi:hypothetical protein